MFEQEVEVEAPDGTTVKIEISHDSALQTFASFLIVACGWLNQFKDDPQFNTKFDGNFTDNIVIRKAIFPWARMIKAGYWVFTGFTNAHYQPRIVVIHYKMTPQARVGTLMHELMHVFYDESYYNRNPESFIQEKAIENTIKIIKNYKWITHPNNEHIFREHKTSSEVLSLQNIEQALAYLQFGMRLHFWRYTEYIDK